MTTPTGPAEQMRELHRDDPMAASLGIELVAASDDEVRLEMPVNDRHLGNHGLCHGGVLFSLADVAMSYISNRRNRALATRAEIEFVRGAALGDVVSAIGRARLERGKVSICDVELLVDGETIGLFRGQTLATGN